MIGARPARLFLPLVVLSLLAAAGCGDWARARFNRGPGAVSGEQLLTERPWLGDLYPDWRVAVDYAAPLPASELAGFPVGNGEVFGATGLHYPLGCLENLLGPTYQRQGATVGALAPLLLAGEAPVSWTQQETAWVRAAGVVRTTSQSAEGLTLTAYDFAPPQTPALLCALVVANQGPGISPALSLGVAFSNVATAAGQEAVLGTAQVGARCGFLDSRVRLVTGAPTLPVPPQAPADTVLRMRGQAPSLRCPVGRLRPGQSVVKLMYVVFTSSADRGDQTLAQLRGQGLGLLDRTREYWNGRLAQTTGLRAADSRLADFLEIEKYLCQVQQAAGGGFSPMHGYTNAWIRDSNGPVRYLLACGDHEAVRRFLDYQFLGYAQQGRVSNNLRLDLDLTGAITQPDWSQVEVPGAEIASFMILQRYWYWRHTADAELIRAQWPLLRRCLLGQAVDARGTLPFFGDETYRFPGYELFKSGEPAPDYVCMQTRSLDSAVEYVVAAQALAEMAEALGLGEAAQYRGLADRVRQATERLYWQDDLGMYAPALSDLSDQRQRNPVAPINLHPLWLGYASPDERQVANLSGVLRYLSKPSGTVLTTPQFGSYVPMSAGYLLHDLALTGHPARDVALQGLLGAAERSGGFAEMDTPQDRPAERVWGQHRFRPWEGGLNAEAALFALTGAEVDAPRRRLTLRPWLPEGLGSYEVSPLLVGADRLSLEFSPQVCRLRSEAAAASGPLVVDLHFQAGEGGAPQVSGNWRQLGGNLEVSRDPYGGQLVALLGVKLPPGGQLEVGFAPGLHPRRGPLPAREEFRWGAPGAEQLRPVVLLTWDPQTLAEQKRTYGERLGVLDTKITWPLEYLRACLFGPDGRRRAEMVVADLASYPGAFRRADYWQQGEGGQLLVEFQQAGGKLVWLQTGRAPQSSDYVPDI